MTLWLHESTHDAVDAVKGAVVRVRYHGGDDGVVWSLSGGEDVRMVRWLEAEIGAAVLQGEAAAFGNDAGAEAAVVAVDEGAAVAVLVGCGEVDSIAVVVGWGAVFEVVGGFFRIEEFGTFGKVGSGYQVGSGYFDDFWIGDEPCSVCETDAQGFDDGMEVVGSVVVFLLKCGDLLVLF